MRLIRNHIVQPQYMRGCCIWPAVIQAGAGLLGGLLSNKSTSDTNETNLQIAREQNKFNQEQWERERDFTKEMWNANNAYNDPSAQMKRLVDAGMSPVAAASVLGAGDSMGVSTPSGAPAAGATMQAKDYSYIGQAAQSAVAAYQAEQKNAAEIQLLNEQARGAAAEAEQKEMYNDNFAAEMFRQQLLDMMHRNKKTWYEAEQLVKDVARYDSRYDMERRAAEASIGLMQVQTIQGQLDALLKEADLSFIPERQKADLALLAAQAYAARASGDASLSQKDLNELIQNNMPELSDKQRKQLTRIFMGKQGADFLASLHNANVSGYAAGIEREHYSKFMKHKGLRFLDAMSRWNPLAGFLKFYIK